MTPPHCSRSCRSFWTTAGLRRTLGGEEVRRSRDPEIVVTLQYQAAFIESIIFIARSSA